MGDDRTGASLYDRDRLSRMRVIVALEKCQGYANCVVEAPDLFDLDLETGKAVVLLDDVAARLEADARSAVANCPVAAITIEG